MSEYYYATITYRSGDKVRVVHKGREPTEATMKRLGRINAIIEVGDPLPPEKAEEYERVAEAVAASHRAGWHPQMDVPGDDDA